MSSLLKGKGEKLFPLVLGPHLKGISSSRTMIWGISAALLPIWISSFIAFGWNSLRVLALTVICAAAFEFGFRVLTAQKQKLKDGSAILTGALLGLLLPPTASWQATVVGVFIAIVIGKEMFGGLGQNLFHPALAGYVALHALFPQETASFSQTVSAAISQLFFENRLDLPSGPSVFSILIAGVILLLRKWIFWQAPLFYLTAAALTSYLIGHVPIYGFMNGSVFFCAFFLVTDGATTPITKRGRCIFAATAGVLTASFFSWMSWMESVVFSVLLMNAVNPLLDRFVRPQSKGLR